MMGGEEVLRRRYSDSRTVTSSSDGDKDEPKTRRRLRGKDMDYHKHFTTGMAIV